MNLDIDLEDKHMLMMEKLMYMLGKRVDRFIANMNIGDPKQHALFPEKKKNSTSTRHV